MIRLCRIDGIPVRLDAGWVLVGAVVAATLASGHFPSVVSGGSPVAYWAGGFLAGVLLFGSAILHEASHAVVARLYGLRVSAITIHVFGGLSETKPVPPLASAEVLIAIVGPLTSFAIGAGALAARHAAGEAGWAAALLAVLGLVNVAIGLVNLLPGFPLDGGRLLRSLLWWWSGDLDGSTTIAARVGAVAAGGFVALGLVRIYYRDIVGGVCFVVLGAVLFHAARPYLRRVHVKPRVDVSRTLDRVA